jgi:hypothetical protein
MDKTPDTVMSKWMATRLLINEMAPPFAQSSSVFPQYLRDASVLNSAKIWGDIFAGAADLRALVASTARGSVAQILCQDQNTRATVFSISAWVKGGDDLYGYLYHADQKG